MLISEPYRKLNQTLHETDPNYGVTAVKHARLVKAVCDTAGVKSVLDYGCGKQTLKKSLPMYQVTGYDPSIPGLDSPPEPTDVVYCGDVLEHIEPECIDAVLDDLKRVTRICGVFVIASRPSSKLLADGRNSHLIIEPMSWWAAKLETRFRINYVHNIRDLAFTVIVLPWQKQ